MPFPATYTVLLCNHQTEGARNAALSSVPVSILWKWYAVINVQWDPCPSSE